MNVGFCDTETYARKLDALRGHCESVGRSYEEIKKTYYGFLLVFPEGEKPERREDLHLLYGTVDQVTEEIKDFIELGVEHFIFRFADFPDTIGLKLFLEQVMPQL
jgi:alkanesulfonate monooxygenase SsuD/methylene tetrahydromethanopterin reductase-like flavin-dependent oxidoreductase (luciferase family)